tara:strand:- start:206 stop:667 length:462 start_codon:yes stop_codon:yes gene_type:complete
MSRNDENRFSVLVLERDVLVYRKYKTRYNFYYDKYKRMCHNLREANVTLQEKERVRIEMEKWYDLYINKLRYLEKNYRRTNIYTRYHEQLENNNRPQLSIEQNLPTAIAQPCSPVRGQYVANISNDFEDQIIDNGEIPTAPTLTRSQELSIQT